MTTKPHKLARFHDQIVRWRHMGLSFQEIAQQLQAQGVAATKGPVYNHFVKEGILTADEPPRPMTSAKPLLKEATLQASKKLCEPEEEDEEEPEEAAASPTPPVQPVAQRFPDLDRFRATIASLLNLGHTAEDIHGHLQQSGGTTTTLAHSKAYVDGLREELFPIGPIPPELFTIQPAPELWPDDLPILKFGDGPQEDVWTLSDFSRGTVVFGSVGGGKTTGSGRNIAGEFLRAGYGGLVLTCKQSESTDWLNLIKFHNREQDIALIKPKGGLRCNLLQYATSHPGAGREFTENMVAFFRNLVSVVSARGGHNADENFWRLAGDQLIRQTINARLLAGDGLTLDNMCQLIVHAPTSDATAAADKWPTLPVFGECLLRAQKAARTPGELRTLKGLEEYWLFNYPDLNPNTRSCITFAFSAMVDAMRDEHIYDLLSTYTNITPESIFNGRIVILELPIAQFENAGVMTQAAWKYCFLRAALRRMDLSAGAGMRPVFLWEDEFQSHVIDFDPEFQRVAREYRVARVMLTQNIQNLYDRFGGGSEAKTKVDSLLGNINTRIFHANGDHGTNTWASESFGTHERTIEESSSTPQVYPGFDPFKSLLYQFKKPIVSKNYRIVREPLVHPHEFLRLLNGGKQNGFVTEAFVSQVGRIFGDGWPVRKMAFRQVLFQVAQAQPTPQISAPPVPRPTLGIFGDLLRRASAALTHDPAR
ncbi:MAG: TraM recognition domain-containing protein [Phycisphaerae bacterium]